MVTVGEADSIIHQQHFRPSITTVSLDKTVGRILAEEVRADRDLPPFNRATMDGIAIAYSSFQQGTREFQIKGIQPAGVPPMALESFAQCIEIMTGGVVPNGADVVVRYEDLLIEGGKASVQITDVARGQNIHRQGADASRDSILLSPSQRISPAEVALLASLGYSKVKVFASPRIAVVSTGDELVSVDTIPKPWQVRISNAHALMSALGEIGFDATFHHISDNPDTIYKTTADILNTHDVVILSGGVSKGKFDYVPSALAENGIEKMFHEVSQRPGKPLWFGRGKNKTVFALPGNPVSTFMCFHRYVKPWLERSLALRPQTHWAKLTTDFQFKAPLTYFLQVTVHNEAGMLMASPDAGGGSGDFANLRNVDGFLELPLGQNEFRASEIFPLPSFPKMIPILFALVVSIALMIALMRVFGFHPFFSLVIAAVICGLLSGQNFADVVSTMQAGFGSLLAQIGFIVTLGSCLGMMMEKTGAMEVLSLRIVNAFGHSRAVGSMTAIGLLVGIPVFCDSGFIILSRLIPSIAAQASVAPGNLALALSSGLYTTHILVPPTPGPLAAATAYGLAPHIGVVISIGLLASLPVGLVAYVFARRWGGNISELKVTPQEKHSPHIPFWQALLPLVLPIILIALAPAASLIPGMLTLRPVLNILGQPVVALSIGLTFAFFPLLPRWRSESYPVKEWMTEAIKDAGVILLITGAGGAFGAVIKASGIDALLRQEFGTMESGGVLILAIAFLVAAVLKTAQGSSTSSMIITSSLVAPLAIGAGFAGPVEFSALVVATGAGAMTVSHANDSYFWVISQFGKITASDTLRTFTVMTAVQGLTALLMAVIIYLVA